MLPFLHLMLIYPFVAYHERRMIDRQSVPDIGHHIQHPVPILLIISSQQLLGSTHLSIRNTVME